MPSSPLVLSGGLVEPWIAPPDYSTLDYCDEDSRSHVAKSRFECAIVPILGFGRGRLDVPLAHSRVSFAWPGVVDAATHSIVRVQRVDFAYWTYPVWQEPSLALANAIDPVPPTIVLLVVATI